MEDGVMKKNLIVGLMLLVVGYAASQVMSQSPPNKPGLPANFDEKQDAASFRESFNDDIQRVREKLAANLRLQIDPLPQDVALLKSLDKYIASNKLGKIIMDLEEFAKQSPQTDEAKKAIAAIQVLKAEPGSALSPTPDPNTYGSARTYVPAQPRNRSRNEEDAFESER
jgi:hypothetical protein